MLVSLLALSAQAQVPDRQIPPSVLSELRLLENRFDIALSMDCDSERCFSKGCTYVDHAVADRPRATTLPGLGGEPAMSPSAPQEYLTQARCQFAHEEALEAKDIQVLSRRLQTKLSGGWLVVTVSGQKLQPLPPYLQEPPEIEEPEEAEEEEPEPEPVVEPELSVGTAVEELWDALLPHFFWMIGLGLFTFAAMVLIWAWRRVGTMSVEDQLLMAELSGGAPPAEADTEGVSEAEDAPTEDYVAQQEALWRERLEAVDPAKPDPDLQALVRTLLRTDLPLLAAAVLRYPDGFPKVFPQGGEVATAKLELAEFLKTADPGALPQDEAFFRALNRHALSATVVSQSDARIVQSLREDFGAAGLVGLIGQVGPRPGALLFALAPSDVQQEMVRLLEPRTAAGLCDMLLRSTRMDPAETAYLFELLDAVRAGQPVPSGAPTQVTDRGAAFDAAGALSVLLPALRPDRRTALFGGALERFHGSLPSWYRRIFYADLLFSLGEESRNDLMLGLDSTPLAAWVSLLDADTRSRLVGSMPNALKASVTGVGFGSRTRQLTLAWQGREALAAAFQSQLARSGLTFEDVVGPTA